MGAHGAACVPPPTDPSRKAPFHSGRVTRKMGALRVALGSAAWKAGEAGLRAGVIHRFPSTRRFAILLRCSASHEPMPDEFLFDVFLSHSAKDKAVVRPLTERLRADGVRVWFDEWVLKPGDSIGRNQSKTAKIEEGLERSRVLVLCMSANAFGSDWAQLESGTFRFRDSLNKERRFLPLCLESRTGRHLKLVLNPSILNYSDALC